VKEIEIVPVVSPGPSPGGDANRQATAAAVAPIRKNRCPFMNSM
jgi:hypothetical protein